MKYLHYIFMQQVDLGDEEKTYVPAIKIKHCTMWLYATDMASLSFYDWLLTFGSAIAKVGKYDIDKVSFNISRKFTIVAFYQGHECLESTSFENLMFRYWSDNHDGSVPDVVKYLNLNMTTKQQYLCNPNLFLNNTVDIDDND